MWTNKKFKALSVRESRVWFFLLSNPVYQSPVGVFVPDFDLIAFMLGGGEDTYTAEDVKAAFRKLEEVGLIVTSKTTNEVGILSYLRYQYWGRGGRPAQSIITDACRSVQDDELLKKIFNHLGEYRDNPVTVDEAVKHYFLTGGSRSKVKDTVVTTDQWLEKETSAAD